MSFHGQPGNRHGLGARTYGVHTYGVTVAQHGDHSLMVERLKQEGHIKAAIKI